MTCPWSPKLKMGSWWQTQVKFDPKSLSLAPNCTAPFVLQLLYVFISLECSFQELNGSDIAIRVEVPVSEKCKEPKQRLQEG